MTVKAEVHPLQSAQGPQKQTGQISNSKDNATCPQTRIFPERNVLALAVELPPFCFSVVNG